MSKLTPLLEVMNRPFSFLKALPMLKSWSKLAFCIQNSSFWRILIILIWLKIWQRKITNWPNSWSMQWKRNKGSTFFELCLLDFASKKMERLNIWLIFENIFTIYHRLTSSCFSYYNVLHYLSHMRCYAYRFCCRQKWFETTFERYFFWIDFKLIRRIKWRKQEV